MFLQQFVFADRRTSPHKNKVCYVKVDIFGGIIELPHGKTNNLHRRKQRRRSASQ